MKTTFSLLLLFLPYTYSTRIWANAECQQTVRYCSERQGYYYYANENFSRYLQESLINDHSCRHLRHSVECIKHAKQCTTDFYHIEYEWFQRLYHTEYLNCKELAAILHFNQSATTRGTFGIIPYYEMIIARYEIV